VWELSPAQVEFVFDAKGLLRKRGSISDLRGMVRMSGGRIKEVSDGAS
jgi:hypothetical protein